MRRTYRFCETPRGSRYVVSTMSGNRPLTGLMPAPRWYPLAAWSGRRRWTAHSEDPRSTLRRAGRRSRPSSINSCGSQVKRSALLRKAGIGHTVAWTERTTLNDGLEGGTRTVLLKAHELHSNRAERGTHGQKKAGAVCPGGGEGGTIRLASGMLVFGPVDVTQDHGTTPSTMRICGPDWTTAARKDVVLIP